MNKKRIGRWPLSLLIMLAITTQAMLAVSTSGADAPEDDEEIATKATPIAKQKTKKVVRRKKGQPAKNRRVQTTKKKGQGKAAKPAAKKRAHRVGTKKRKVTKKSSVASKQETVSAVATQPSVAAVAASAVPAVSTAVQAPASQVLKANRWASVDVGGVNQGVKFSRIDAGSRDNVWATVDTTKSIYQLQSDGGFELQSNGDALAVSVGADNTVAVVNIHNDVFLLDNGAWKKILDDKKMTNLAVVNKDSIFAIEERDGRDYVWHYKNGAWEQMKDSNGQEVVGFNNVSANAAGTVFLLTPEGELYQMGNAGVAKTQDAFDEEIATAIAPAVPAVASAAQASPTVDVVASDAKAASAEAVLRDKIKKVRAQIIGLGGAIDKTTEAEHNKKAIKEKADIEKLNKEIKTLQAKASKQTNRSLKKQTTAKIADLKKKKHAIERARRARLAGKLREYQAKLASLQPAASAPAK